MVDFNVISYFELVISSYRRDAAPFSVVHGAVERVELLFVDDEVRLVASLLFKRFGNRE